MIMQDSYTVRTTEWQQRKGEEQEIDRQEDDVALTGIMQKHFGKHKSKI